MLVLLKLKVNIHRQMKKLIPNLLALLVAVGLIAYTGCGGEVADPNAVDAGGKDISEDFDGDNPEDEDPKSVPEPKDPEDGDDPDPSGDE